MGQGTAGLCNQSVATMKIMGRPETGLPARRRQKAGKFAFQSDKAEAIKAVLMFARYD